MIPVYCSFYTLGTEYEREAAGLVESLRSFGIGADVRGVPNLGEWTLNCGLKPQFIRERMREHPDKPIVWLDADARVKQYPSIFEDLLCDFAAHWKDGTELLSGTLYFGPTEAAKELVNLWCDRQQRLHEMWDQQVLQGCISLMPPFRMYKLPAAYTRIFDAPEMCPESETIIMHHQASRRLRNAV